MRTELTIGLFLNALNLVFLQFNFLPDFAAGFVAGMATALGIFFLVVGLLPEKAYNNLAYRKLLAYRNR